MNGKKSLFGKTCILHCIEKKSTRRVNLEWKIHRSSNGNCGCAIQYTLMVDETKSFSYLMPFLDGV